MRNEASGEAILPSMMLGPAEAEIIRQSGSDMGIAVTDEAERRLLQHANAMIDWNRRSNLSAITSPADVAVKHIVDSLACLLAVDRSEWARSRVIDVGSGAGYPGLALAAVEPPSSLALLEATQRKAAFLSHVVAEFEFQDVIVIPERAEDLARRPEHRGAFDFALVRAVAELAVLIELCLPLLRLGGSLLAMKSVSVGEEIRLAAGALAQVGGEVTDVIDYRLPGVDAMRTITVVLKVKETSDRYPRRAGIPEKRPLR